MTAEGQRLARVATVRRQDNPKEFVEAWALFRALYLFPPEAEFYDPRKLKPSPDLHYRLVNNMMAYPRNVIAAPRGSAKSTVLGVEIPLFISITRDMWKTILCLASERLVEEQMSSIMQQITENPLIIKDFGKLAPTKTKGQRIWNRGHLHLANNSRILGVPAKSKKRGLRPNLFLLDDPEYDPSASTNTAQLRDDFEHLLFHVIMPMLDPGCYIYWFGTIVNRQSFIHHAVHSDGSHADSDPRFALWHRECHAAEDTKTGELIWEQRLTREFLNTRKAEIGFTAYAAEYLNEPLSESDKILNLDDDLDTYHISGTDVMACPRPPNAPCRSPLNSTSLVHYTEVPAKRQFIKPEDMTDDVLEKYLKREPIDQTKSASELFGKMLRFITVDRAFSMSTHADYSCVHVLGLDKTTLWSLDLWLGRAREDEFIKVLFNMGLAWRVAVIGIETAGTQIQLYERAAEYTTAEGANAMWRPRVMPIKYEKNEAKASRIAALEWRFNQHRIKLPLHRRNEYPYSELFSQVQNFTMDLALLRHDDAIDTLAMYSQIIKHPGGYDIPELNSQPDSFEGELQFQRKTGIPLGSRTFESGLATEEFIEKALAHYRGVQYNPSQSGSARPEQIRLPRRSCFKKARRA